MWDPQVEERGRGSDCRGNKRPIEFIAAERYLPEKHKARNRNPGENKSETHKKLGWEKLFPYNRELQETEKCENVQLRWNSVDTRHRKGGAPDCLIAKLKWFLYLAINKIIYRIGSLASNDFIYFLYIGTEQFYVFILVAFEIWSNIIVGDSIARTWSAIA